MSGSTAGAAGPGDQGGTYDCKKSRSGAATVVGAVYARFPWSGSSLFNASKKDLEAYFIEDVAQAIVSDVREAEEKSETGKLDFEPLYDAQDGVISDIAVCESVERPWRVRVTFRNIGRMHTLNYVLVDLSGKWRIKDIEYEGGYTLRGILLLK
jgi:hypothetical protein